MPKASKYISIKGARVNNLKNIDIDIPRNKLIVITGLSGSGKSSLAFDTLYAEGQRRYVESLSSYARQFLGRMNKPEVDKILGIPPAIAIEQKVNTRNPRSTVGTSTEIYDYLKLLFSRVGKTYSPVSGKIVKKHSVSDVVDFLLSFSKGTKALIISDVENRHYRKINEHLELLLQQGFNRFIFNEEEQRIETFLLNSQYDEIHKKVRLIVDRISISDDEDNIARIADSVETAFFEGKGECTIKVIIGKETIEKHFSIKFEADGIEFEIPELHHFSFNNPLGACPKCEGYGKVIGIDENLVIPDMQKSIYEDSIACWKGEKMGKWKESLVLHADKFDFPIFKPYYQLSEKQKKLLWTGNKYFQGLNKFFKMLEESTHKIQYRIMLSRYRGKTVCPECNGTRLKKESTYVKVAGKSITELVDIQISDLLQFFSNIDLDPDDRIISDRLLLEIQNRLQFLNDVGLGYLTLNRLSSTLSGGESQRINLATSLGSSLVGSLYILDEPSIGLHPADTELLIGVIRKLQKLGNTVIVVEHDEEMILSADRIIDIGPFAGTNGGEIVFEGTHIELLKNNSLTSEYITGKRKIDVPKYRRKWNSYIDIIGAYENNLKGFDVKIPLGILTVVTGVSGSGKTSLVHYTLFPAVRRSIEGGISVKGNFVNINGDISSIGFVEYVDQNPIGKSSRSNPVTYLKAFDEIRKLYSEQEHAKYNGFNSGYFSFNIEGGRCDECQGEGIIKVEMQFMADVHLICESCKGNRFKEDILEVKYRNKNIFDILELTVDDAMRFFSESEEKLPRKIVQKLKPLQDVGLGYVKLGQASSTLSGGESQRVKLASFLANESSKNLGLFIFDEPTTGLHFHDIKKLLESFSALIKKGHSIIIIEHNPEIIKSADWVIDLGPGGGDEGGNIVFEGTPEDLIKCNSSQTAKFLKEKLE